MAPVVFECRSRSGRLDPIVCSTGQQREMQRAMTAYFEIQPDVDLDLMWFKTELRDARNSLRTILICGDNEERECGIVRARR